MKAALRDALRQFRVGILVCAVLAVTLTVWKLDLFSSSRLKCLDSAVPTSEQMESLGNVVCFAENDWANLMYEHCHALSVVGVPYVSIIKLHPHPFNYKNQAEIVSLQVAQEVIAAADVVLIFFAPSFELVKAGLENKKWVSLYLAGDEFRSRQEHYVALFRTFPFNKTMITHAEFAGLGLQNEYFISATIDTSELVPPRRSSEEPYVVCHYASHQGVKGTPVIREALAGIQNVTIRIGTEGFVSRQENIERMRECDVYVELYSPTLNGRPYGQFGTTAFEAAAVGSLVITQNLYGKELYANSFGECPLILVESPEEITAAVKQIIKLTPAEIDQRKRIFRAWVVRQHSYIATGYRIVRLILGKLP